MEDIFEGLSRNFHVAENPGPHDSGESQQQREFQVTSQERHISQEESQQRGDSQEEAEDENFQFSNNEAEGEVLAAFRDQKGFEWDGDRTRWERSPKTKESNTGLLPAPLTLRPAREECLTLKDILDEGPPLDSSLPLNTSLPLDTSPPKQGKPRKASLGKKALASVRRLVSPSVKTDKEFEFPISPITPTRDPSKGRGILGIGRDLFPAPTSGQATPRRIYDAPPPSMTSPVIPKTPTYHSPTPDETSPIVTPEHLRLTTFTAIPREIIATLPKEIEPPPTYQDFTLATSFAASYLKNKSAKREVEGCDSSEADPFAPGPSSAAARGGVETQPRYRIPRKPIAASKTPQNPTQQVGKTRKETGTEAAFRGLGDIKHPRHSRAFTSKNLWCTDHEGKCAVCGCGCCALLEHLEHYNNPVDEEEEVEAKQFAKIVASSTITPSDKPTFIKCPDCNELVCPECIGVCPLGFCQYMVCKKCKPSFGEPCEWHNAVGFEDQRG